MGMELRTVAKLDDINADGTFNSRIRRTLMQTPVRRINDNGEEVVEAQTDTYYLSNSIWTGNQFKELPQFEETLTEDWFQKLSTRKLRFEFKQDSLNLELKYIVHQSIFKDKWSITGVFRYRPTTYQHLQRYVNGAWPNLTSFADMQTDEFLTGWRDYLVGRGLKIEGPPQNGKVFYSAILHLPHSLYAQLQLLLREQHYSDPGTDLWQEDVWHISYFRNFGIDSSKSDSVGTINLSAIQNTHFRDLVKETLRDRLRAHTIEWGTAHGMVYPLKDFLNFVHERHPDWEDLRNLQREDCLAWIEHVHHFAQTNLKQQRRDANIRHYPKARLATVRGFFAYLQKIEHASAPKHASHRLIEESDTSGYTRFTRDEIRYLPEPVLNQFFEHIADFPDKYLPLVLVMYYTGLRVSDALELTHDCLETIDGQSWIRCYVRKTKTEGHRCPIPDDFAVIMANEIERSKRLSTRYNNPDNLIFAVFEGYRRGKTYSPNALTEAIRQYVKRNNIVDENGQLARIRNHAFRHTFSVKMINNGADILTVMELLAHASPKMTMRYARLLESTKREAFDNAITQGVFTFETREKTEVVSGTELADDVIHGLWQQHKLNAVDTPYGTCLQRKGGKCSYGVQPPCLTCNDGAPCLDLCVGAFEGDQEKYAVHIASTEQLAETAKRHGRQDMAAENQNTLKLLRSIKETLDNGGVIYGRGNRLKEQR